METRVKSSIDFYTYLQRQVLIIVSIGTGPGASHIIKPFPYDLLYLRYLKAHMTARWDWSIARHLPIPP